MLAQKQVYSVTMRRKYLEQMAVCGKFFASHLSRSSTVSTIKPAVHSLPRFQQLTDSVQRCNRFISCSAAANVAEPQHTGSSAVQNSEGYDAGAIQVWFLVPVSVVSAEFCQLGSLQKSSKICVELHLNALTCHCGLPSTETKLLHPALTVYWRPQSLFCSAAVHAAKS